MPPAPIRIFVGTEEKTKVPFDVLSYSIKRHSSMPVEIVPMIGDKWQVPKGLHQGTGFSLRRFMIPAFCDFEGHAIYMDADQLVFGDVAELWGYAALMLNEKSVACTYQVDKFKPSDPWPQTSVMLFDCGRCGWVPEEIWNLLRAGYDYHKLMHLTFMAAKPIKIPNYWNHLNVFEDNTTRLLHYTKEPEQPWYKPDHSLSKLWELELVKAIADKAVNKKDFEAALALWDGPRIDKRPKQGFHPYYKKYLPNFK